MAELVVSGQLLELASRRSNFAIPAGELVFFGIRGAVPDSEASASFAAEHSVSFATVDYVNMCCTIGQWDRKNGTVALYEGSTVPALGNIISAKAEGGSGTNRLIPGKFLYEKGIHKPNRDGGHRAFRQAAFFPVQRSANDLSYNAQDPIDFGTGPGRFVWDNLHSAYSEAPGGYSSAGCQVVRGLPMSRSRKLAPETGPWRKFVETAYERFAGQQLFTYLLFTAEELGVAASSDASQTWQVVKFGSSGPLVKKVQGALQSAGFAPGPIDSEFGRSSLKALVDFQIAKFGAGGADGVCGANSFAALGIEQPSLQGAQQIAGSSAVPETSDGTTTDMPDESDLPEGEREKRRRVLDDLRGTISSLLGGGESASPGSIDRQDAEAAQLSLANFERAQEIIREFEGKFVDHPDDPGGATNFGITRATLAEWRNVLDVSVADVKNLSYNEAKEIYKKNYWDKNNCGEMPGPVALVVYNTGVHCGTGTAACYLQRSLNKRGAGLKIDGRIGGNTLAALRLAAAAEVCDSLIGLYEERLMGHPKIATFRDGFENRVKKLREEAAKWLAEPAKTAGAAAAATPNVSTESKGVIDMADNTDVVKKLVADLGAALAAGAAPDAKPPAGGGASPPLGQVNGALGDALGTLLNGKKSAIGIVGALLTTLLNNPGSVTGDIGGVLVKWLPMFAGSGGTFMPIFLAIFAWGVLGKMEKWTGSPK
jgi:lysozyme family protein